MRTATTRRRFDEDADEATGGSIEELRQQLLEIVQGADTGTLKRIAAACTDSFDESDESTGLERHATDNIPTRGAGYGERRRGAAKFSESQHSDWDRVKRYIERNRRELDRLTPGASAEMLDTFARAIGDGYTARDLLPRGA